MSAADFMRFLFRWQHVQPGTQLHGRDGLLEVIGQLAGLRAAGARVGGARAAGARRRYDPNDLEQLCLAGAVAWGRLRADAPADDEDEPVPRRARSPDRAAPLAFVLREDLPWLLAPGRGHARRCRRRRRAVLEHLARTRRVVPVDIARATRLLPAAVEEALWTLVARGLVTGDGVAGLRALHRHGPTSAAHAAAARCCAAAGARLRARRPLGAAARPVARRPSHDVDAASRVYWLRRWGVVMRELLARETRMPPVARCCSRVLRTLEARGEIRGGRFVARHGRRAVRAARGGRDVARGPPPRRRGARSWWSRRPIR